MDRLLTADELAERLGMKTEWVWAQARAGRIPHVRLGRYRRFRESAVEEWLRELETGGTGRPVDPAVRAPSRCAAARSAATPVRPPARVRRPSAASRGPWRADSPSQDPIPRLSELHVRQQIDGQLMDTLGNRRLRCRLKLADYQDFLRVSDGTRTHDRLDHNQELYQLSYAHRGANESTSVWLRLGHREPPEA